jgi:hypothetical protein
MTAQTEPSPAAEPQEQSSRVPMWLMVLAALALAVVGAIIYGYLARPGWIGVAGKKFWDYLHLLIVPTALVIGGYLLNQAQRDREIKAEQAQQ